MALKRYLTVFLLTLLCLSSLGLIKAKSDSVAADLKTELWDSLKKHTPSSIATDKIALLQKRGNFSLQRLDQAGGKIVNLDYFPVTIQTFPKNPATGKLYTPGEFLTYLRLNFNDFIDQKEAVFSPSNKTGFNEDSLWKSANPLGAIVHIHIPLPAGDGSVICTEYTADHWVYSTVKTPWRPFSTGYDGKHPVSGFRRVGFIKNANGSVTYYTAGIDKISSRMSERAAKMMLGDPFKKADELWLSLQKGIYDFVTKNGGTALELTATPYEIQRTSQQVKKD